MDPFQPSTAAQCNLHSFMAAALWRQPLAMLVAAATVAVALAQLSGNFYDASCPHVESIVRAVSEQRFQQLQNHPAQILRSFFHDCFVEGCDGSVLIASTPENSAERDAEVNRDLVGDSLTSVDLAKAAVEDQCPGRVSCADILAILARDMLSLAGGPSWNVQLGRRDGRVSVSEDAQRNMPLANFSLEQLLMSFFNKGLNMFDLVALSGSHTIGVSHCNQFDKRIYNFSRAQRTDPSLDPSFAQQLKNDCPIGADASSIEPFDLTTPFVFDNQYYKNLEAGKGLLTSDQSLFAGNSATTTGRIVRAFAANSDFFFQSFVASIDKLSRVGVKTGNAGEIRRTCSTVNT